MSFNHCERCKGGYILPGEPKGEMRDGAYFTPGPAASTSGPESGSTDKKSIVLLTDIFGLPLVNCKIVADRLAESVGCDVWIPDQFGGWPVLAVDELDDKLPQKPGEHISLFKKLGFLGIMILRLPRLIYSRPSVVDQRIHAFIKNLREEKGYTKIGAVGYCFGGMTTIRLAGTNLINSGVICHPGRFTMDQVAKIKVPTSWQCAEEDMTFSPELRDQTEAHLAARKDKPDFVDYEFHDYKGTVHGFAMRPNLDYPESKEGFEKSLEATINWFKKTL